MRTDIALFLTTIAAIAIVSLIVKNHTGSSAVIREIGNAGTSFYGTIISANPQFYERARGFPGA